LRIPISVFAPAFVSFFGARNGLVHISQLASSRVQTTSDVVKGRRQVKLLGFDDLARPSR
jgi:polyribonucleotide nucleotidyltransferase